MRDPRAACVAFAVALGLGLASCAAAATGPAIGDGAPLAVVRAAQSSLAASPRHIDRPAPRRPAIAGEARVAAPTPPGPDRPRSPVAARALAATGAARLAAPACAQYAGALAGRFPDAVLARAPRRALAGHIPGTVLAHGSGRALAVVIQSVGAALLGMPVAAPAASLPARKRLDDALDQLTRALAAPGDASPATAAATTSPRIRGYARALGIEACG